MSLLETYSLTLRLQTRRNVYGVAKQSVIYFVFVNINKTSNLGLRHFLNRWKRAVRLNGQLHLVSVGPK